MNKGTLFLIVALSWTVIIAGFILYYQQPFWSGQEVTIEASFSTSSTAQGQEYLYLRPEHIRGITLTEELAPGEEFFEGDRVYVTLITDRGQVIGVDRVSKTRPEQGEFIRGRIFSLSLHRATIEYGFEQYYIPRGQGATLRESTQRMMHLVVAIDRRGQARVKTLRFQGEELPY